MKLSFWTTRRGLWKIWRLQMLLLIFQLPSSKAAIGEWPGYLRGNPAHLAVNGGKAYVANSLGGLLILNVENPSAPFRIGQYDSHDRYVNHVAVSGNLAVLAVQPNTLEIVDVTIPSAPVKAASYILTNFFIHQVGISGSLAFVAGSVGLQIFDISNPALPIKVGEYVTSNTKMLSLNGNRAYLGTSDGIKIISLNDASNPTLVSEAVTSAEVEALAVSGNRVFYANWNGLHIAENGYFQRAYNGQRYETSGIAVSGNYVYLTGDSFLNIIELTNQFSFYDARHVGTYDLGRTPTSAPDHNITVASGLAFLSEYRGISIADISNPESPQFLGWYSDSAAYSDTVAVSGDLAFLTDFEAGLQILDVSDPRAPVRLAQVPSSGRTFDVAVEGNLIFVAADEGLNIFDISNPRLPVKVGSYSPEAGVYEVIVRGNRAFLLETFAFSSLIVLDVGNPSNPSVIGRLDTGDSARGLAIAGSRVLFLESRSGLRIVDVSNEQIPVPLGSLAMPGIPWAVTVVDTRAFVTCYENGLEVLDISGNAPARLGRFDTPGAALGISISGNTAFVADRGAGVQAINVHVPAQSALLATFPIAGGARGVTLRDNLAYVAAGAAGLQILDISTIVGPKLEIARFPGSQTVGLQVVGVAGQNVTLQASSSVNPQTWSVVTNLTLNSSQFSWTDSTVSSNQSRFYRAVRTN